jgi:hypothetical protein
MGNLNPIVVVAFGLRPPIRAKFRTRWNVQREQAFGWIRAAQTSQQWCKGDSVSTGGNQPIHGVISFGTDEMSASANMIDAQRFGPTKYEPPGVAWSNLSGTNRYHRTYQRVYTDEVYIWRCKVIRLATHDGGDVGEVGNLAFHHTLFPNGLSPCHAKSASLPKALVRGFCGHAGRPA